MSARAPSAVFTERENCSPETGAMVGSTATFPHTSVSWEASRSRTSLWQMMVKPPRGHTIAWGVEKSLPHTQWVGTDRSGQEKRRARASRKSPFARENPCSWRGTTDNQDDAPFTWMDERARRAGAGSACWSASVFYLTMALFSDLTSALAAATASRIS